MNLNAKLTALAASQVVLVASIAISAFYLLDAKSALIDSVANERECRAIAASIQDLRRMKSVAEDGMAQSGAATSLDGGVIERWCADCGIASNRVPSIVPQTSVVLEKTPYRRQDWRVNLQSVSMQEAIKVCLLAEASHESIAATSLEVTSRPKTRISGAFLKGESEVWNASLTLTQLIYDARRSNDSAE